MLAYAYGRGSDRDEESEDSVALEVNKMHIKKERGKENNILTRLSAASMILQMHVCRHQFVQRERDREKERQTDRERERERERERDGEREREREREMERERWRERE